MLVVFEHLVHLIYLFDDFKRYRETKGDYPRFRNCPQYCLPFVLSEMSTFPYITLMILCLVSPRFICYQLGNFWSMLTIIVNEHKCLAVEVTSRTKVVGPTSRTKVTDSTLRTSSCFDIPDNK